MSWLITSFWQGIGHGNVLNSKMKIYANLSEMIRNGGLSYLFWECDLMHWGCPYGLSLMYSVTLGWPHVLRVSIWSILNVLSYLDLVYWGNLYADAAFTCTEWTLVDPMNTRMNVIGYWSGMAHRLNLADNRLPIFDQSRLPITDIL